MRTESFIFTTKREFTDILTQLSRMNINAGNNYELRIGPAGDMRTVQRVLYFRWLGDLVDFTGHSKDELHETFKEKFLRDIYYRDEADFRADTDAGKKELHVHHRHYVKGRQPWQYEIDELVVLCSDCHKKWHDAKEQLDIIIGNISVADNIHRIVGYALAVSADVFPHEINELNIVGFADAFRTNIRTIKLLKEDVAEIGCPIGSKFILGQML